MGNNLESQPQRRNRGFSIENTLSVAWRVFKNNIGIVLCIILLNLAVSFIPEIIIFPVRMISLPVSFLLDILHYILYLIFQALVLRLFLDLVRKRKATIGQSLKKVFDLSLIARFFGGLLLYFVVILAMLGIAALPAFLFFYIGIDLIGFLFAIFAGIVTIWVGIRIFFVEYFIIDKNVGPVEGIKASYHVTRGYTLHLILLAIIFVAFNILGLLALIIGIFVTSMITQVAIVAAYDQLQLGAGPRSY